jgi:hypothetical protein
VARGEPEANAREDAVEAIAPDRRAKQFRVLRPAAPPQLTASIHQRECLDVSDHRLVRQPATVRVRRQRAPDAEPIRSGLLLHEGPWPGGVKLRLVEVRVQRGPLDSCLDLDLPLHAVELDHSGEAVHVDHVRAAGELLSAHRMTPSGDAHRPRVVRRRAYRPLQRVH